jgi:hypothetical protein
MVTEYPGCGSRHGKTAAMKLQVRTSLKTGSCDTVRVEAGRDSDVKTPLQKDTPLAGSLRIADAGYFDSETLERIEKADAYWLSPLRIELAVFDASGNRLQLLEWLETKGPVVDSKIQLTTRQMPCRIIAWRLPPAVAARRRHKVQATAKRKCVKVSAERLARCDWAILITNLPVEKLTIDEARVFYRSRWQIELLFKRWKSQGRIRT